MNLLRALILLGLSFGAATPAGAEAPLVQELPKTGNVKASLGAETAAVTPGAPFLVGLHFKIRKGWHTYWKFAGDSGAPTTIEWQLPPGFTASDIIWQMPIEVPLASLMDYGYEDEVMHLVSITAPQNIAPGAMSVLQAKVDWLVCSDEVCIPEHQTFTLNLPGAPPGQTPRPDPEWGDRIAAAVDELPVPAPFEVSAAVAGNALKLSVHDGKLASELTSGATRITYYPYQDGIIRHAVPQKIATSKDGAVLTGEASYLATSGRLPNPLSGLLILARSDGSRTGYEISAPQKASLAGVTSLGGASTSSGTGNTNGTASIGFLSAILFALLGGLILNLMPCVFPVLSMKALAFAKRPESGRGSLRTQGWLFTAGVMASFVVLAAVLFALRQSGAAIGWGYQLQSPTIVLLLAYLMFIVGLSLSGVLAIGARFGGAGDTLARKPGAAGAFFTGVLATLVATPCTAPFMGAALGYALIAPPWVGLSIFLALGAGLSLPFLILSHSPRALAWLPKPGPWMEHLKQFLAFPMYAAAAWLIWVLAQQAGPSGLLAALAGLVLIGFAAWVLKVAGSGRVLWFGRAAALAAGLSAVGLAAVASQGDAIKATVDDAEAGWTRYTPAVLRDAIAAGRPVFVDATAAWCLTCKVNELGTLSSRRVRSAFDQRDVLLLRADWTNRDPDITELLSQNGRLGVPLYLYYAKDSKGAAHILPQILTEDIVLATLEK